jgi:hypothetical protein
MLTGTELASDERAASNGRTSAKPWLAAGLAGIVFVGVWLRYSPGARGSSAGAPPAALLSLTLLPGDLMHTSSMKIPENSAQSHLFRHNSIYGTWFTDRVPRRAGRILARFGLISTGG